MKVKDCDEFSGVSTCFIRSRLSAGEDRNSETLMGFGGGKSPRSLLSPAKETRMGQLSEPENIQANTMKETSPNPLP